MSINLKKRMTTDPEQSFLRCAPLALRQEDLTTSDLCELQGGNGNSQDKLIGTLMTETGINVATQPTMPGVPNGGGSRTIDLYPDDRSAGIIQPVVDVFIQPVVDGIQAFNTAVVDVCDWASEMWDLAQRPSSTPWNRGS